MATFAQMGTLTDLAKKVLPHLQKWRVLDFSGEHSLGIRLRKIGSLIENRKKAKQILRLTPTMWRLLSGNNTHTLYLPNPVKMQILPTNLACLVHLWGKIPCKTIEPEHNTIVWEILPGRFFKTRTDAGLDLAMLFEIFIRNDYGSSYKGLRVLDIGGYHGESSIFFVSAGAQSVVCVEPSPSAYSRIVENLKLAGMENQVKVISAAVGAARGEAVLLISESDSHANLIEGIGRTDSLSVFSSSSKVPVLTFEDVLNEAGWAEVDVAKVDCEGCEYTIFSSTADDILRRVKVWIMEFHKGPEFISQRLRSLGYQVEYPKQPDKTGFGLLRAWLPGATLPWLPSHN